MMVGGGEEMVMRGGVWGKVVLRDSLSLVVGNGSLEGVGISGGWWWLVVVGGGGWWWLVVVDGGWWGLMGVCGD